MIQAQFATAWSIFTPTVFRLMEREYVERFFETGELMLSSFSRFSQHEDEERKDDEGANILVGRGSNSTVFAVTGHGDNAYILCGSAARPDPELCGSAARPDPELVGKLNVDAAIQIFDTTAFAAEITREIPGVLQGFEGYCIYVDKAIETKINDVDLDHLKTHPEDTNLDLNRLGGFILNMAGQAVFFRKRLKFRHQMEYRWVWITSKSTQNTIIINAPRARNSCLPWFKE